MEWMKKTAALLEKYAVELMVALYLLYKMYITMPAGVYNYVSVWYVLDYSYGFGSRLMIGSILHALFGDFIDKDLVHYFLVVMLMILCLLVAVFSGMVYRKMSNKPIRRAILFFTAFYIASPASPEYLWTSENIGRLDTYLFINTIVLAIIGLKVKNSYLKYALFVIIGIFTISIHQVYMILFFPSMLVMLIQDFWNTEINVKQKICLVMSVFILGIVFLYMQFGSGIYYDDLDVLVEEVGKHTNLDFGKAPLEAEYFWSLQDHFVQNQLPELHDRIRFGALTVCMLVPIWGMYLYVWIKAIKSRMDRMSKLKYIVMLLTNLIYVPVFALMTDWGRWFAAFFVVAFINILVLAYQQDDGICIGLCSLGEYMEKNGALFLLLLLYVGSFEKFEGINMMQQVQDFFYNTYDLKVFFLGR